MTDEQRKRLEEINDCYTALKETLKFSDSFIDIMNNSYMDMYNFYHISLTMKDIAERALFIREKCNDEFLEFREVVENAKL